MNPVDLDKFWSEGAAAMGDAYRPHTATVGLFLFREKLRRRGYEEGLAPKLPPKLLARAVPWADFIELKGVEELQLAKYGWPIKCFVCIDHHFDLQLVAWVPGTVDTEKEAFLMTRLSLDRFAVLEADGMDLYDAYRKAEDGVVLRVKRVAGGAVALPVCDLKDEELPSQGQRMVD